ncbi:hypothetical protein DYB37_006748 [Aphanomyces astaci]|uniref:Uncharacterized protein n=1 Tax=Aphanomyces astaci TaxID=112090 RepID=A0A3R7ADV5_APHAT|nr:hypothetical protein DYB37_006748 [Aphanomyces astaci]
MDQVAEIPPLPQRPLIIAEHASAQLTAALRKKQMSATSVARPQGRLPLRRQLRSAPTPRRDGNKTMSAATVVPVVISIELAPKSVAGSSCHAAEAQSWSLGASLGQFLTTCVTKVWCALRSAATSVTKAVVVAKTMLWSVYGLVQRIYTWAMSANVDTPSQGIETA